MHTYIYAEPHRRGGPAREYSESLGDWDGRTHEYLMESKRSSPGTNRACVFVRVLMCSCVCVLVPFSFLASTSYDYNGVERPAGGAPHRLFVCLFVCFAAKRFGSAVLSFGFVGARARRFVWLCVCVCLARAMASLRALKTFFVCSRVCSCGCACICLFVCRN